MVLSHILSHLILTASEISVTPTSENMEERKQLVGSLQCFADVAGLDLLSTREQ